MQTNQRRATYSWALYDWANSAFATTVMAGFFPLFFKQYWSQGVEVTHSTYYLGVSNSVASLIIVILAPILGAMADTGGLRKRMLASFACLGVLATGSLYLVEMGMSGCLSMKRTLKRNGWKDTASGKTRFTCEKRTVELKTNREGNIVVARIIE